jgi:hypothetical protein
MYTKYRNFQPRSDYFLQRKLQSWYSINEVNPYKDCFFKWKVIIVSYFIPNAASRCGLNINNKQTPLNKRIHLALKERAITLNSQQIRSMNSTTTLLAQAFLIKLLALSTCVIPQSCRTKGSAFWLSQFVPH